MTIKETSRSEFITLRGLRYHVRHWGKPGARKLFMLHGWMDVAASFQFLVDHLHGDWHVIAPDWRGFGETDWPSRYPGTQSARHFEAAVENGVPLSPGLHQKLSAIGEKEGMPLPVSQS